jgi:hypothetical protein
MKKEKKEKICKGYKGVFKDKDGKLWSLFVTSDGRVQYIPGEWTHPKAGFGGLCVSSEKKYLMLPTKYLHWPDFPPAEFWECEYVPSSVQAVWHNPGYYTSTSCLPEGTIIASKIRLTKKIRNIIRWKEKGRRKN